MSTSSWPSTIRNLSWPQGGIKYSYENRYIKTDKLRLWLDAAFENDGKYVVGGIRQVAHKLQENVPLTCVWKLYNNRFYITAPRKPSSAELQWLMDPARQSGVQVPEYGWLALR